METNLPDLRIVPVEVLVPHEQHDLQRSEPLVQQLLADGVLKNPPVVAPRGQDDASFVILDGANRHAAAVVLNLPHLLVQVADYNDPQLRLLTWHHVVSECSVASFRKRLGEVAGLNRRPGTLLHARAALARRECLGYIVYPAGDVELVSAEGDLRRRTAVLNQMVDSYKACARLSRTTSDRVDEARQLYEDLTAVVVFPRYDPAEIVELTREGVRLPAGITRHLVPHRALRINYPLDRLAERGRSLNEKNAALQEWLRVKVAARQVRSYTESTVLFDE